MKRKKTRLNVDRDLQLLLFLWRWKLSTTAALAVKFFPALLAHGAYKRLMELQHAGFIQAVPVYSQSGYAWSLTNKGFHTIRHLLCELKEVGYRSEFVDHDFLVSAVHLGNWFLKKPAGAEFLSEQEIRRYSPEFYPYWTPKEEDHEKYHRPDGYWLLPTDGGKVVVALEVELNRKTNERYEKMAEFYGIEEKIYRVLWVVTTESQGQSIQDKISQANPRRANIHNFVTLKDFLSHGWGAPIQLGPDTGKTIDNLMWEQDGNFMGTTCIHVPTKILLEVRKSPSRQRVKATA